MEELEADRVVHREEIEEAKSMNRTVEMLVSDAGLDLSRAHGALCSRYLYC